MLPQMLRDCPYYSIEMRKTNFNFLEPFRMEIHNVIAHDC